MPPAKSGLSNSALGLSMAEREVLGGVGDSAMSSLHGAMPWTVFVLCRSSINLPGCCGKFFPTYEISVELQQIDCQQHTSYYAKFIDLFVVCAEESFVEDQGHGNAKS